MSDRIPRYIELERFCTARKQFTCAFDLSFFPRIREVIYPQDKIESIAIKAQLDFGIDELGYRFLKGIVETNLSILCQRCMQEMEYPVRIELNFAYISSSQQEQEIYGLYESYWIAEEQQLSFNLYHFLEDEILLSLPLIAKHDEQCVDIERLNKQTEIDSDENEVQPENPFAVLSQLKKH